LNEKVTVLQVYWGTECSQELVLEARLAVVKVVHHVSLIYVFVLICFGPHEYYFSILHSHVEFYNHISYLKTPCA
jgi:hypothetical protein